MNILVGYQRGISKKNVPYLMLHTISDESHHEEDLANNKSWIGQESFSPVYVPEDGTVEISGQPELGCKVRILREGEGNFSKVAFVQFVNSNKKS